MTAPGLPRSSGALWLLIATLVGLGVAGAYLAGLALLVGFTVLITLALFYVPKPAVLLIGIVILLQPLLINLSAGGPLELGTAIRRLDEVLLAAGLIRILVLAGNPSVWRRIRRWIGWILFYLATGIVSGLVAGAPLLTMTLGAFLAIKFPAYVLLALTIDWDERDATRLVRLLLVGGGILLVSALLLLLLPASVQDVFRDRGGEIQGAFFRDQRISLQGPLVHPGVFGWAMAVSGCAGIVALLQGRKAVGVSAVLVAVVGILASLRRKPLVAFPLAALSAVAVAGSRRRRVQVVALILVVGLGTVWFARSRIQSLVSDAVTSYFDSAEPTAVRALLYLTAWRIGGDRFPLGEGFGRYGGYISQARYSPIYDRYGLSRIYGLSPESPYYIQDTFWPHVLGEAGWLGVVAFGGMLLMFWRACTQLASRPPSAAVGALATLAAMILVEGTVESVAAPIFEGSLFAFTIAVPIGITLVLGDRASPAARSESPPPPPG